MERKRSGLFLVILIMTILLALSLASQVLLAFIWFNRDFRCSIFNLCYILVTIVCYLLGAVGFYFFAKWGKLLIQAGCVFNILLPAIDSSLLSKELTIIEKISIVANFLPYMIIPLALFYLTTRLKVKE